jgi:hypothetical protein
MKLGVKFSEKDCSFTPGFGEVQAAGDGGYERGYEQGKIDGNVLLYAVSLPSYANAVFPDGYELTLNIPNFVPQASGADMNFGVAKGIKRLKLVSTPSDATINLSTAFNNSSIEELDMSEFHCNIKVMVSTFLQCRNLREIKGELNLTSATFNTYEFYNCTALEEIRIKAGTIYKSVAFAQSSKLSAESIQSIVDGLADLTGQTAQKITLHTTVLLQLSEEQLFAITAKNWTM